MVTVCPTSLEDWEEAEKQFSCNSSDIYHCLLDEFGKTREVCTLPSWIEPELCSIFNTNASKIDTLPCDKTRGKCPDDVYWSTHVFRYSACYTQNEDKAPSTDASPTGMIIGIFAVVVVVVAILLLIFIKRRRLREREPPQEGQPLLPKGTIPALLKDHLDDTLYVTTRAFDEAKQLLDENKFVILVGPPGSGKTEHGLELLHKCGESGGKVRQKILNSISGWKNELSRNSLTCILFDACLGRWNRPSESADMYLSFFEEILSYCGNGKLYAIFTIRSIIWQQLKDVPERIKGAVVDLSHEKFVLNVDEKKRILESHFKHFNYHIIEDSKDKREKENYTDKIILNTAIEVKMKKKTLDKLVETKQDKQCSLGFPEACSLFCRVRKYTLGGTGFFKNPYKYMKDNGILHRSLNPHASDNQRYDYAVFVYVMLKGGVIDSEQNEQMFHDITESLELQKPDVKCIDKILQYHLDYFVRKFDGASYRFLHSSVLEFVFKRFGEQHPKLLIQYCHDQLLLELINTQNPPSSTSDFEVKIEKKHYNLLAERVHEISLKFPVVAAYQLPIFNDKKFKQVYERMENEKEAFEKENENDDFVAVETKDLPSEQLKETGSEGVEVNGSDIKIEMTTSGEEFGRALCSEDW